MEGIKKHLAIEVSRSPTNQSIQSYGHSDTGFSDHELIKCSINFDMGFEKGPGAWKNNVKHYETEDFSKGFKIFWEKSVNENRVEYLQNVVKWWVKFKYDYKLFYIDFCRKKITMEKRHDQILEWGLFQATAALNLNPNSNLAIQNYTLAKKGLVD